MTAADALIFGLMTLVGVSLSAMFSGLETGLYTINRVRLTVRAAHGDHAAVTLRRILARPTRMLATILVANNIANYLASFGLAKILDATGFSAAQTIMLNVAVLIPLLFVFGEVLPKDLFRTHTDRWSYACAGFLRVVSLVLTWSGLVPIVQQFGALAERLLRGDQQRELTARQRVSRLIQEGVGAGVLSEVQTSLADRCLALRDQTVRDEMVAWSRVKTVAADTDPKTRLPLLRSLTYSRFPVIDGKGAPVGIVALIDLILNPDQPASQLMSPPLVVRPSLPVRDALRIMRDRKTTMAVVMEDGNKTPLGLVTLKDLVEPLTGQLAVW